MAISKSEKKLLSNAETVVDRDPERRIAFSSRTLNLYDDLKIQRREAERALIARFTSGQP